MPTRRRAAPSSANYSNRVNEVIGLILVALAVFIALSIWSFHSNDPSWSHRVSAGWSIRNYGGLVGAYLAGEMVQVMGSFSVFVPLIILVWGLGTFAGVRSWCPGWRGLGVLVVALSGSGLFYKAFNVDPLFGKTALAGGIIGYGMAVLLEAHLGRVGSAVALAGVFLAAVVATTGLSISQVLYFLFRGPRWVLIRFLPRVWSEIRAGTFYGASKIWSLIERSIRVARTKKAAGEIRKSGLFLEEFRESWTGFPKLAVVHNSGVQGEGEGNSALESSPDLEVDLSQTTIGNEKYRRAGKKDDAIAKRRVSRTEPVFGSLAAATEDSSKLFRGPAAEEEMEASPVAPKGSLGPISDESNGAPTTLDKISNTDGAVAIAEEASPDEAESDKDSREHMTVGKNQENPEAGEISPDVQEATPDSVEEPSVNYEKAKRSKIGIRIGQRKSLTDASRGSRKMQVRQNNKDKAEKPKSIILPGVDSVPEEAPNEEFVEKDGVKVRHAGVEGEAEIVQIEDDSLVSEDAPQVKNSVSQKKDRYVLPGMNLLADVENNALIVDEGAIREKSTLLEKTLREFDVEGRVAEVKTGPVITIYEFAPAAGVKVSKIASLSDDLARALSALSVRIVAPIPGTNVVGIEVPNSKRRGVRMKELLSSQKFQGAEEKLTLGLGKDILGRTVVTDLAKIPHLLIAGSTGSGKSVAMNLMICSLLARCHPREVRFLMIDPKMLEFSIYEGIPHLLVPVVTEPKKAASALRGVVAEMERRYQVMSKQGVRNIESYNELVAKCLGPREAERRLSQRLSESNRVDQEGNLDFLPYIVVVIDELADLMMVSSREVEETMTRLAQMARAAGIHLLVATQRPSVDVLTGLIKANFPSRIALRVASRTDSRTILDMNGAERLLGKGDMLFIPPGTNAPVRIHGAYVSEKEIKNFVDYWRGQGPTDFHEEIFVQEDSKGSSGAEDEDAFDERYDDAVALVARTGEGSISLIQRHLRIGYNRAARLIERMEREGVVGPSEGAKRRQVLIRDIPSPEVESIDAS